MQEVSNRAGGAPPEPHPECLNGRSGHGAASVVPHLQRQQSINDKPQDAQSAEALSRAGGPSHLAADQPGAAAAGRRCAAQARAISTPAAA